MIKLEELIENTIICCPINIHDNRKRLLKYLSNIDDSKYNPFKNRIENSFENSIEFISKEFIEYDLYNRGRLTAAQMLNTYKNYSNEQIYNAVAKLSVGENIIETNVEFRRGYMTFFKDVIDLMSGDLDKR